MRKILLAGILVLSGCVADGRHLNTEPYQPSAQEIANNVAMDQARRSCGEAKVGMSEKEKEKIYSCIKKGYREKGGTITALSSNSAQLSQQPCGFTQEFFGGRDCRQEQMDRALGSCEARKTWVEMTECKAGVITSYRNDPFTHEISAYSRLLIEKVKARKMTSTEAEYAIQQKVAEVNQRLSGIRAESRQLDLIEREQDMRANQERARNWNEMINQNNDRMMEALKNNRQNTTAPAPVIKSPTTTTCNPDGYGGMRCTTY